MGSTGTWFLMGVISYWPTDVQGQVICGLILVLFVLSMLILAGCCHYRKARAQKMLAFLNETLTKGILGGIPSGMRPDASSSDVSQLNWWIRELPSCRCPDSETRGALNGSLARGDWYKLSNFFLACLDFLTEICSVYPMLGILGTVIGVYSALNPQDPSALINSFSTAVTTTIWGIFFGIAHTVVMSFFYSFLHELDEYPAKIDRALYDLKQNIHHGAKKCDDQN